VVAVKALLRLAIFLPLPALQVVNGASKQAAKAL
jgi:hypothetical protein